MPKKLSCMWNEGVQAAWSHDVRTYRDETPYPTTTAPMVLLIVGAPDGNGNGSTGAMI